MKKTALDAVFDLREDGILECKAQSRIARPTDVPVRTDLPKDHPLYGQRVLKVVPSGMGDCTIDADGKLIEYGKKPDVDVEVEIVAPVERVG